MTSHIKATVMKLRRNVCSDEAGLRPSQEAKSAKQSRDQQRKEPGMAISIVQLRRGPIARAWARMQLLSQGAEAPDNTSCGFSLTKLFKEAWYEVKHHRIKADLEEWQPNPREGGKGLRACSVCLCTQDVTTHSETALRMQGCWFGVFFMLDLSS